MNNNNPKANATATNESKITLGFMKCESFELGSKKGSFTESKNHSNPSKNNSNDSASTNRDPSKVQGKSETNQTNNIKTQNTSNDSRQQNNQNSRREAEPKNSQVQMNPNPEMKNNGRRNYENFLGSILGMPSYRDNEETMNSLKRNFNSTSMNNNLINEQGAAKEKMMQKNELKQGNSFNTMGTDNQPENNVETIMQTHDIDFDYLYSLVSKANEKDMIEEYAEQFNDKADVLANKDLKNDGKEKVNGELIHKKPKLPKPKNNNQNSNNTSNNTSKEKANNQNSRSDTNQVKNRNGSKENSESNNSSNSNNQNDNINNNNFFSKYNANKQLDDSKLNSLKYNLMNKNSTNPSSNLTNLLGMNAMTGQMRDISNISALNSQITAQMKNQIKHHLEQRNGENFDSNAHLTNLEVENLYLKTFIMNKLSAFLSNSSLGEKLTLYNLISQKDEGIFDFSENSGGMPQAFPFSNSFNPLEKHFQKEVVKFTIENFCKFLKTNGYCIVKNAEEALSDKESQGEVNEPEEMLDLNEDGTVELTNRKENTCPHTDKKHYAKNMCNACYHREGRVKKAWLCPHPGKIHYARGKCRNCYLNTYHKVNKIINSLGVQKQKES